MSESSLVKMRWKEARVERVREAGEQSYFFLTWQNVPRVQASWGPRSGYTLRANACQHLPCRSNGLAADLLNENTDRSLAYFKIYLKGHLICGIIYDPLSLPPEKGDPSFLCCPIALFHYLLVLCLLVHHWVHYGHLESTFHILLILEFSST